MALAKRSAGNCAVRLRFVFHHASAPMVPALLAAFTQKGAAIPKLVATRPPSAGPSARLMLTPTLFIAIAGARSSRGTSCGTTDCHAGDVRAEPVSIRNVNTSSEAGPMKSRHTSTAKANDTTEM